MEGNPTSEGNLIPGGQAFAFLDPQGSLQVHQGLNPQFYLQGSQFQDVLPSRLENMKEIEKPYERVKKLTSDNNGINFDEGGGDGCYDGHKGKGRFLWQRVKWTAEMVKLLINAVYYIEEDASSDCLGGVTRKPSMLQRIGKWKCVSKLMVERGYHVSPQQCEDKFNCLNKRYKRLNDVLGRGTSCKVVENPELLDIMNVSDKVKEEVKKILSSKNLFYEEMCSYHTGNRLHLPRDPEVLRSLQLALGNRDDDEPNQSRQHNRDDDFEKEQLDAGADDRFEETEDNKGTPWFPELSSKRSNQMNEIKEYDSSADGLQEQWMAFRFLELKKQKLQIQDQKLELEKQRLKWRRINLNKDRDLEKMRLQNECMKLANERLAFELRARKLAVSKTEYML